MPHTGVELTRAELSDIPLITELATTVWRQHYTGIISDEQIAYMLGLMYSAQSLQKQFGEGQVFYLIRNTGGICGFVSVSEKEKGVYFLHKFYLLQQFAGKGQGTAAFRTLLALLGPRQVTLTVNRNNIKSINFYFKNGFTIDRTEVFDIGNGFVMDDFVMVWRAERPA